MLSGLIDGAYTIDIYTVTSAGVGPPLRVDNVFEVNNALLTVQVRVDI